MGVVYRTDADAVVIAAVFQKASRATPAHISQNPSAGSGGTTSLPEEVRMEKGKRERLENAGWRVGTTQEFLDLSDEEAAFVEVKVALRAMLRARRTEQGLTQTDLATRLGSSRSRAAKIEAGDPSVSRDLLVRGLLATGATARDIAAVIAPDERPTPDERRA